MAIKATKGQYKGHDTLMLEDTDTGAKVSFGVRKARVILAAERAVIEAFVKEAGPRAEAKAKEKAASKAERLREKAAKLIAEAEEAEA